MSFNLYLYLRVLQCFYFCQCIILYMYVIWTLLSIYWEYRLKIYGRITVYQKTKTKLGANYSSSPKEKKLNSTYSPQQMYKIFLIEFSIDSYLKH